MLYPPHLSLTPLVIGELPSFLALADLATSIFTSIVLLKPDTMPQAALPIHSSFAETICCAGYPPIQSPSEGTNEAVVAVAPFWQSVFRVVPIVILGIT